MRLEYEEELKESMDQYEREVQRALTLNAYDQYRQGDAEAYQQANQAIDWMVIDQSALSYIEEYSRLLIEEGATLINGQQIPWMKDWSNEARLRVAEIIEEGIAEGLYPGRKETTIGTYAKDSTAAKLKEFFHDRKSHASTVARTETANIRGQAKAKRWIERDYSVVKIYDGRGANPCAICQNIDGQYWTPQYYQSHTTEHPNCTRTASPVRPESVPVGEYVWGLGNVPIVQAGEAIG